ncbi:hypothetical protein WA026_005663 [Henosepilachna vigintioctopunctata]|uniref:EF-hand domain-containing protein n=1 Tax=Henosepilachna vigintioctopunctata TaxID=420089 RepID=A0AAW1U3K2_9CUCU
MIYDKNKNRRLTDQELLEIMENDEFWEDTESARNVEHQSEVNSEDESFLKRDRLQACTDILVYVPEFLKKIGRDLCVPHMQNKLAKTLPCSLKIITDSLLGDSNYTPPGPPQRGLASKRKRCCICPS